MKQVYYCRCEAGRGLGLGDGIQPRAATAGVPLERLQAAKAYVRAGLPGQDYERLALLDTPEVGRLLFHTSHADGRPFTHLLLDVPETLDADHAIQTWGSPLWTRRDGDGGTELAELPYPPVAQILTDAQVQAFLAEPRHREFLQFVLSATVRRRERIIVAATPDTVALIVYAVARVLPQALLDELTFSTFESDPLASPARITGTCWADAGASDLPEVAYEGPGYVAFNSFSGRQSEVDSSSAFAVAAMQALAAGTLETLDEFKSTWQRLGIKDTALIDFVFVVAHGDETWTAADAKRAMQHAGLAAWLVGRPGVPERLLNWAITDREFASHSFARAVLAMRGQPGLLRDLTKQTLDAGFSALTAGELTRTGTALEVVLPTVAPTLAADVWQGVFARRIKCASLGWDVRRYLLPRLARVATPEQLNEWLRVEPEHLVELLQLDLPHAAQRTAISHALTTAPDSPETLRALAAHPGLAIDTVAALDAVAAKPIIEGLFATSPAEPWLDRFTRCATDLPRGLLGVVCEVALDRGQAHAAALVAAHGIALIDLFGGTPSLDRLATEFLREPPTDLIDAASSRAFLAQIVGMPSISSSTRDRAAAALRLAEFLNEPSLAGERLTAVAAAVALDPPLVPVAVRGRVMKAVVEELARHTDSPSAQDYLEAVLLHLGHALADGPTDLFRDLVTAFEPRREFWKQPELLHGFLAVALGAVKSPELASRLEPLEGEAYSLAQQAAQRGGARVTTWLDRKAGDWPRPARSQWSFLARSVRPRGAASIARDAAIFIAGAVLAIVSAAMTARLQAGP